jgi:hypothetical protein
MTVGVQNCNDARSLASHRGRLLDTRGMVVESFNTENHGVATENLEDNSLIWESRLTAQSMADKGVTLVLVIV